MLKNGINLKTGDKFSAQIKISDKVNLYDFGLTSFSGQSFADISFKDAIAGNKNVTINFAGDVKNDKKCEGSLINFMIQVDPYIWLSNTLVELFVENKKIYSDTINFKKLHQDLPFGTAVKKASANFSSWDPVKNKLTLMFDISAAKMAQSNIGFTIKPNFAMTLCVPSAGGLAIPTVGGLDNSNLPSTLNPINALAGSIANSINVVKTQKVPFYIFLQNTPPNTYPTLPLESCDITMDFGFELAPGSCTEATASPSCRVSMQESPVWGTDPDPNKKNFGHDDGGSLQITF